MTEGAELLLVCQRKAKTQLSKESGLPTEILATIFSFVSHKQTLQSISLCCHHFRQLIAPTLFREIYAHCGRLEYHTVSRNTFHVKKNQSRELSLHLLRHNSFATYVQYVRLQGGTDEYYAHQDEIDDDLDVELGTAVQRFVRDPQNASSKLVSMGTSWLEFTFGDRVTTIVLLLGLLPHLKGLYLRFSNSEFFAGNMMSLNVFKALREITLEWTPENADRFILTELNAYRLKEVMSIHALRKICTIHFASSPNPTITISPFDTTEPGSSLIEHLEFRESKLASMDVAPLFASFRLLKTVVFEASGNPMLGRRMTRPESILSALRRYHTGCLESLWVDFSKAIKHSQDSMDRRFFSMKPSLRELQSFNRLRHICLPLQCMFESGSSNMWHGIPDCLPPSIETMALIDHLNSWEHPLSSFVEDFFELLEKIRPENDSESVDVLPCLKTVVLIANADQFFHCSPLLLDLIKAVPRPEAIFAQDNHHGTEWILKDPVADRVQEIEDMMGLTRFNGKRWKGIDHKALRRGCEYYERLRERHGSFSASGDVHTPEMLRGMSRSASSGTVRVTGW